MDESTKLNKLCIDIALTYTLPDFSPGPDNINDLFKPFPYRFVDKVDMTIFNRWGLEVFTTTNPDINWNGKDQASGKDVSGWCIFIYAMCLKGI
jgi:hypothetical protein